MPQSCHRPAMPRCDWLLSCTPTKVSPGKGEAVATRRTKHRGRVGTALGAALLLGALTAGCAGSSAKPSVKTSPFSKSVLLVGTYHGKSGAFKTIQAAVNAAKPGDWILVAPGDYHE